MAYIDTQMLAERLGTPFYDRLTDRQAGTTADPAVAEQIVAEAQAEADSYLARRYATPVDLSRHPELADTLAARVLDLAEYIAWKSSPFVSDVPDRVRFVYEQARAWLEAVAEGRLLLPAARPPASGTASAHRPAARSTPRTFTAQELDGL